jgi:hypothetical protein
MAIVAHLGSARSRFSMLIAPMRGARAADRKWLLRLRVVPRARWKTSAIRRGAFAVVAVVVLTADGAAAFAGTATVRRNVFEVEAGDFEQVSVVVVAGAPGEPNRMSVRPTGDSVVVSDAGAPIIPGEGCATAADGSVVCRPLRGRDGYELLIGRVRVDLGDGDDTVTMALHRVDREGYLPGPYLEHITVQAHGGDGNDQLKLPGGHPRAYTDGYGEAGNDPITDAAASCGGPGDDHLVVPSSVPGRFPSAFDLAGGPGNDVLQGAPASDDNVSYGGSAVHVDLGDPGPDGHPGEADTLIDIDSVSGGPGPDVLIGDDDENSLWGGGGDDVLRGGGGDDVLQGGAGRGRDRLFGNSGDDVLWGSASSSQSRGLRGSSDRLACGSGRDIVDDLALLDQTARDCETGSWAGSYAFPRDRMRLQPIRVNRRSITFRSPATRIRGSITLSKPGAPDVLYGRWSGRFPRLGAPVRVDLRPVGRRAVARRRDVQIIIRARSGDGSRDRRGYILPTTSR